MWSCVCTLGIFAAAASPVLTEPVSVESLLPQMLDLEALSRMPEPYFTTRQASSYDRKSKSPEVEWFANADWGQYIREETRNGRTERVMADLVGPGAVVRIWSANPAGVLRVYFDGESEPRVEERLADLMSGTVRPFDRSFGYFADKGGNVYFPFPYARSLKVTIDDSDGDRSKNMYYHVTYRQYEPGTPVESFPRQLDFETKRMVFWASKKLEAGLPLNRSLTLWTQNEDLLLRPGATQPILVARESGVAIKEIRVRVKSKDDPSLAWTDPRRLHNLLRATWIEAKFDGNLTVRVPLGDFFGSAPGLNPLETMPFQITSHGEMVCRFPMPFKERAEIVLRNVGSEPIDLATAVTVGEYEWTPSSLHFYAQWIVEEGSTRPMRDMEMLHQPGRGQYVGSSLSIANPTSAWWGEGDEKIYLDGEAFPSTFGTGTEDYYGYAWSSPALFMKPYHSQSRCDGPGTRGHSSINRFHVLDVMPFTSGFRFDMELWHWREVHCTVARTVYWYAAPGSKGPKEIAMRLLWPPEVPPIRPVEGAIEGEDLAILSKSGGVTEVQSGFEECSGGKQLWWRDAAPGDELVLKVSVPEAGRYEVAGNFCFARDYGIQEVQVLGLKRQLDFFGDLHWKLVTLGVVDLPSGEIEVRIKVVGANPNAIQRHMFGLDYLRLKKV